jgi:hypothetical protein
MGLSSLKTKEHIDRWGKELSLPKASAYRSKWPKFLFHHASLQNACKILEAKALLSRNDIGTVAHDDVAPAQIISARIDAHAFARLYFRPKNPTQYNVEGIRKPEDLYLNDPTAHIPLLYMFMFSAESVLKLASTQFSNGNMQSKSTQFNRTEQFFDAIPFDKVFHEGFYTPEEGAQIRTARNAEVLAQSPLDLIEHLRFVLCRSEAEKLTLLHTCKKIYPYLKVKVRTFTEVGIFESRFAYVRNVDVTYDSCLIQFSPRKDGKTIEVEIELFDHRNKVVRALTPSEIDPTKRLRFNFGVPLLNGRYSLKIRVDKHLAYSNEHLLDDIPF